MVSTFDEQVSCGQREFLVSLYLDGDEAARQIAENFARREAAKVVQSPRSKVQGQAAMQIRMRRGPGRRFSGNVVPFLKW